MQYFFDRLGVLIIWAVILIVSFIFWLILFSANWLAALGFLLGMALLGVIWFK